MNLLIYHLKWSVDCRFKWLCRTQLCGTTWWSCWQASPVWGTTEPEPSSHRIIVYLILNINLGLPTHSKCAYIQIALKASMLYVNGNMTTVFCPACSLHYTKVADAFAFLKQEAFSLSFSVSHATDSLSATAFGATSGKVIPCLPSSIC